MQPQCAPLPPLLLPPPIVCPLTCCKISCITPLAHTLPMLQVSDICSVSNLFTSNSGIH
jgi:hypothetical protein